MKNTQYKIILLRHAESEKNLKKIHGGQGECLTEFGEQQAKDIAKFLQKSIDCENLKIFTSTSFHTNATAVIIANELQKTVERPINFRPLYLGVADGLSEKQLAECYPEVQKLFESWRKREIDIKKLIVPNMENYLEFWKRGEQIINLLPKDCNTVMVCSNSLMILLANYLLGNHPQETDMYKHITIQNCGLIVFSHEGINYTLDSNLTTTNIFN